MISQNPDREVTHDTFYRPRDVASWCHTPGNRRKEKEINDRYRRIYNRILRTDSEQTDEERIRDATHLHNLGNRLFARTQMLNNRKRRSKDTRQEWRSKNHTAHPTFTVEHYSGAASAFYGHALHGELRGGLSDELRARGYREPLIPEHIQDSIVRNEIEYEREAAFERVLDALDNEFNL